MDRSSPGPAHCDTSPSAEKLRVTKEESGACEGSPDSVCSKENCVHGDVDGPEVRPCSSSSSSSESDDNCIVDVCSGEPPSALMANGIVGSVDDDREAAGGRLRFFLAGRCVLELAHDTDGDGRPKQWTQTSSKSYYPRPATWIPSTVVRERRERKISPCNGTPESSSLPRKKPCYNGSYFPFAMLRHSTASHFSRDFHISRVCLRRAARNPLRPITVKSLSAQDCKTFSTESNIRKRLTFAQRAERLFRVIECLPRCISVSPVEDVVSGERIGVSSVNCKLSVVKLLNDASGDCQTEELSCKEKGSKIETAFRIPSKELPFYSTKLEQIAVHSKRWPPNDVAPTSPLLDDTPPNTPKKLKKDVRNSSVLPDELSGGGWSIPRPISPTVEPSDERFLAPFVTVAPLNTSKSRVTSNVVDVASSPCSVLAVETPRTSNRGGQKKRKRGAYGRGRTIGEAVRNFVIREILDLGGDLRTKCVPRGVFTEVGLRYKVDATTTYRWWLKYCNSLRSGDASSAASVESSHYVGHGTVAAESHTRSIVTTAASNSRILGLPSGSVVENNVSPASCNRDLKVMYPMTSSMVTPRKEGGVFHSTDVPFRDTCAADSHSPLSNDSQSSGTSIVDPASLYASFVHANVWPQHLPLPPPPPPPTSYPIAVSNGARSLSARLPPLPVGVCFPYVWNLPRAPSSSSVNSRLQGCPASPVNEKGESESAEEPLDLTLPKKGAKRDDLVSGVTRNHTTAMGRGLAELHCLNRTTGSPEPSGSSPNSYSEWRLGPSVLKNTLCDDNRRSEDERSFPPSTSSQSRHSSLKSFNETTSLHPPLRSSHPQRNMKPKHYPFLSLQIGTFEIHSKMSSEGDVPNKFKVIFTKRKFVYEFETKEGRREEGSGSRQMACIVVPFNIVEAFWCCDTTIVFRVVSKPSMFVGHRQKQVGCVPSLTVYETKRSVDLTGGQLGLAHLHKVTLLKPHLVERLKIYLVLFDVQFRNVTTTASASDSMLPVDDLQDGEVAE